MGIGLSFFMQIFVFIISSARSKSPLIKGVLLSTEENELGIKVGGVLSILGDVVYNFKDKTDKNEYLFPRNDNYKLSSVTKLLNFIGSIIFRSKQPK